MTVTEIINNVLAGGLLGVLGQGIRIAVGLKKLNDNNKVSDDSKPPEKFDVSRLWISIFIGFAAGAIGMLIKGSYLSDTNKDFKTEAIVTIMAIGYSGADFIEGVFNTYISKFNPPASGNTNTTSQSASNNASQNIVPDEATFSNGIAKG